MINVFFRLLVVAVIWGLLLWADWNPATKAEPPTVVVDPTLVLALEKGERALAIKGFEVIRLEQEALCDCINRVVRGDTTQHETSERIMWALELMRTVRVPDAMPVLAARANRSLACMTLTNNNVSFPRHPYARALAECGRDCVPTIVSLLETSPPDAISDDLVRVHADVLVCVYGCKNASEAIACVRSHCHDSRNMNVVRLLDCLRKLRPPVGSLPAP